MILIPVDSDDGTLAAHSKGAHQIEYDGSLYAYRCNVGTIPFMLPESALRPPAPAIGAHHIVNSFSAYHLLESQPTF